MQRTVIGVVGPMASGKGVIISALEEVGYMKFSLSDTLREMAKPLHLPPDSEREVLQDFGDLLRRYGGNSYLAEQTIAKYTNLLNQR